ncbi:hypothetical protein Tco_0414007 [Tanacetum coccineum]
MTTPSPSPPISLSPPSAGERLARCMAPPAHSSPLLPSSGCPTISRQHKDSIHKLLWMHYCRMTHLHYYLSQHLILYIPPLVDRRDDVLESEQPPRKRLCLSTLGSRYEIGDSSTARPTRGRGIDYGFVSTVDVEERRQGIRDVGYGVRDTWVDPAEAHQTQLQLQGTLIQTQHQVHETRFLMQQAKLAALRETNRRRQAHMVVTLRVIRDMRREMSDMQAELLSLREQQRRARQPGPEARIQDHQDASGDADSHI